MASGRLGTAGWDSYPVPDDTDAVGRATLTDPSILSWPNPFYERLRHHRPVHWDARLGMYLVSRYEDLQKVMQDNENFSLEAGYKRLFGGERFEKLKGILIRDGGGYFPDFIMSDPPHHKRLRQLLEKAFTAHRVKLLEPAVATLVGSLIDRVADRGEADGVEDLAIPMTISIMCEQLGLGHADGADVRRWSTAYVAQLGGIFDDDQMLEYARDICDLQNYLIARVRERQACPREDMISDLVTAQISGDDQPTLSFEEIVASARALLVGGNDTTATALTNLLLLVATEPGIAKEFYASATDDRRLTRFVEELIRIEPPVRGLSRVATRAVELNGTLIPEGAQLLLLFASGNDDADQFACPRDFDSARPNLTRHLSFGVGIHKCIGMALARMEIKVAAREIARRLTNIELACPVTDIGFVPSITSLSMTRLPLKFRRARFL